MFLPSRWSTLVLLGTLLLGVAAAEDSKFQSLMHMLSGITSRPTWRHRFTMPLEMLLKARTVGGDESRLEAFMQKVVTGEPVKWAVMGSSISTAERQAGFCDVTWFGMLHRWLELTFTPCGKTMSMQTVRTRQHNYTKRNRKSCPESTIEYVDLSRGASSCILNEKCMMKPEQLPPDVDMVFIEYTATAGQRDIQRLQTSERLALERMIRFILLMPNSPAIIMFHVWSPRTNEGGLLGPIHFGPGTEDFHNLIAMHYGIQVMSARAVLYDLLNRHDFDDTKLSLFEPDGLHPMGPGQHIYGDMFIAYFQSIARRVMSTIMVGFLNKDILPPRLMPLDQPSVSYAEDQVADTIIPWPPLITEYVLDFTRFSVRKLPGFLIPGNHEHADGHCIIGQELEQYATSAKGFQMRQEEHAKWGFIGESPGDSLVLELDTTLGGRVKPLNKTKRLNFTDGIGTTHTFVDGTTEVLLSYLRTYENVGNAQVKCVEACKCDPVKLVGLWEHRASVAFAQRIRVTPSSKCRLEVTILPDTNTSTHKFKVVSVVLSELPFHFDAQHLSIDAV